MDVPPLLFDLHEDAVEENVQPSRPHIQGSTINAEQIAKHDDNGHEEDATDELEADEVDLRVASGDRGPEGEKVEQVPFSSTFIMCFCFSIGSMCAYV
jgi:hypothetical protein